MENKKPSNPEAFPILDPNGSFWNPGMTLRDYFASKIMNTITIKSNNRGNRDDYDYIEWAKECYKRADAMLKVREEP
jgi:hypothetical protein